MPLHLLVSVAFAMAGLAFFFWISLQDGESELQALAEANGVGGFRAPADGGEREFGGRDWKQAA